MYTTSDLAYFGEIERNLLIKLLQAWNKYGLPDDFNDGEIVPMINKKSRNVFLTNNDYQVAMMNGDKLESWYSCANCGNEGFLETCKINDDGCNECVASTIKIYSV